MATEQKTAQHHPDVQRDFETGTVNPGPGMAGPIDGKTHPGTDQGQGDEKQQPKPGQKPQAGTQTGQGQCGSCGCG